MTTGVGLSIGATNVAATIPGRATVTRQSVLTLYRHRPPEVGVPSDNPRLDGRGLIITGFVDRAADPVGIVAGDGTFHRGEVLIADALRALTYAVTGGLAPAVAPAVTFPAHWHPTAVDAVRRELARLPEWSDAHRPTLISDAAAGLTALQAEPGLPTRGVVALCDFGGTGTSITLADAADGYRPIGATVRHADFSGELIDRALLAHVLADLSTGGSADVAATAAIGSLHRLRAECRGAKERLSRGAVTTLFAEAPGHRGDVRLTRSELDDEIRRPLAAFIEVLRNQLLRNRIHVADLAAIASIGGGAHIPVITTTLSEELRVPVITVPQPELTAANGAALRAVRLPEAESMTVAATPVQSGTLRALAWSEADDIPEIVSFATDFDETPGLSAARPEIEFVDDEQPSGGRSPGQAWYRPLLLTAGVFAAMVLVGTGAVMALRNDATAMTATPTTTTTVQPDPAGPAAAPPAELAATPEQAPSAPSYIQAPAPRTVVATPPPVTVQAPAPAVPPPPAASPPPPSSTPAPPSTTTTTPTTTPTTTTPPPPSSPPSSPPTTPTTTPPAEQDPPPQDDETPSQPPDGEIEPPPEQPRNRGE